MKKMQMFIGGILPAGVLFMTACFGNGEEETTASDDVPSSEVSQFDEENGSSWREKWQEETASGVAVNVNVYARISVPSVKQMAAVEVQKYPFSKKQGETGRCRF